MGFDQYSEYRDAVPYRYKLTQPVIVTEEVVFNRLMEIWKRQISSPTDYTVQPIYFHMYEKTYAVVLSQYKKTEHTDLPYIELSRCEIIKSSPDNNNTDIPFEVILAMPYHLFELVARNQVKIRQELGYPILIEKLWGWGEKCTVHHVLSQNYFDVNDPTLKHPYLSRQDLTEDQKRYMMKEFIDFLDILREVRNNYTNRITISVLKNV